MGETSDVFYFDGMDKVFDFKVEVVEKVSKNDFRIVDFKHVLNVNVT